MNISQVEKIKYDYIFRITQDKIFIEDYKIKLIVLILIFRFLIKLPL